MIAGAGAAQVAVAGTQARLHPDLVTLRLSQHDLSLRRSGEKLFLRLTNEIGNRGRGPLEIYPSPTPHDCDGDGNFANDRDTYQRVFLDSNADRMFDRTQDTGSTAHLFGCERFHPRHDHWHLLDFTRYKLVRVRSGRVAARSTKIGFCIIDSDRPFENVPGSLATPYYPAGSRDCDRDSIDGLSVGWSDTYAYSVSGQRLDVTGLRGGRYCLVSRADPSNLLRESDDSNNARRTPIGLRPAKREVQRLAGRCRRHR